MKSRIEICGGIASGKSTLAKLISESFELLPIYEDFKKNPFWIDYYREPGKNYFFQTEITFALLHYHQILQAMGNNIVCDFSFVLDKAYAEIGLNTSKKVIFSSIMNEIYEEIKKPKLLIYLKCNPQTLLNRIKIRNRDIESNIELNFLVELDRNIVKLMNNYDSLVIDSGKYDYVNNEDDKEKVIELIANKIKY